MPLSRCDLKYRAKASASETSISSSYARITTIAASESLIDPAKVFHVISMLLSCKEDNRGGVFSEWSEAQRAHRHRMFQCSMPVLTLRRVSISLPR